MGNESHLSNRESTIDALRGNAVLFMILAHAIFFFHSQENTLLNSIELFANTIVLTLFIFISGASYSKLIDLRNHGFSGSFFKKTLINCGYIYLAYSVVSAIGIFSSLPEFSYEIFIQKFLGSLTLNSPTNFTEYMILFLFFPFSGLLFNSVYKKSRSSLMYTLAIGLSVYALGMYLYPLTVPYPFNTVKILFAGGNEMLRFPILFYFPIYLIGIWWEHKFEHTGIRKIGRTHIAFLSIITVLSIVSLILSAFFDIPIVSIFIRWPPSIGFLLSGLTASALMSLFWNTIVTSTWIHPFYRFITYCGRDSLDLWTTHLLLLFFYKKFIGIQFNDTATVLFLVIITILLSILFSSIRFTNSITLTHFGSLSFPKYNPSKLKKRYIVYFAILISFVIFSLTQNQPQSLYGEKLPEQSLIIYDQIPHNAKASLSIQKNWFIRNGPWKTPIQIQLNVSNPITNKPYTVNPALVTFSSNDDNIPFVFSKNNNGSMLFEISPTSIPAGKYFVYATINTQNKKITSNVIPYINSEPLIVAWTLDWEGWDVSDNILSQIASISSEFAIPFTQFVNPRTFISDTIPNTRKDTLQQFLLTRNKDGDEIALHIHMHYDLIEYAGVPVKKTKHWGLLSNEGYDVPTPVYTPEEFEKIVISGLTILKKLQFPPITGYRAGGWYITGQQIAILSKLGFSYDSSGRDKASNGAFSQIPWQLLEGAQPYFPSQNNQNIPSSTSFGILEIPNNGVTTYESSANEILTRFTSIYTGSFLTKPVTFIVTSHPQFAQYEFKKIPTILSELMNSSHTLDKGPVVFGTMNSITSLWTSSQY